MMGKEARSEDRECGVGVGLQFLTESSGKASMTFEQKPEGDEEARHVAVWKEGFWTEGRVCAKVLR